MNALIILVIHELIVQEDVVLTFYKSIFLYKIFKIEVYPFSYNQLKERIRQNMSMILKTTDLCKSFSGLSVVNNLSLNIEKNSVYGLLGPNGAGKSTILGLPDKRIDEVLQIVRLTGTGKKRAGQFSLGMKQRLGIAIALLNNPKLLILDEPTNGLDPVGIEELRELIRSFPSKGITVILSSHILSEVQQTADHIGIIAGGVLGYEGKLGENENLEQLFMDVVKSNYREG